MALFKKDLKDTKWPIEKVDINGQIFYRIKGMISLHSTPEKAERQREGLMNGN